MLSFFIRAGALLKNYREVRLPGITLGEIHHSEWRLPAQDQLI